MVDFAKLEASAPVRARIWKRPSIAGALLLLSVGTACSGGDDASNTPGGSVTGPSMMGTPNAMNDNSTPCTMGAVSLCMCMNGGNGTSTCQIDGTFSVCDCDGSGSTPSAGNGAVTGGAGTTGTNVPPAPQAGAGTD